MAVASPRRTRDDWTAAGLETLLASGPDAVTVEGVAKQLKATKGSGYWHFQSRADLLSAVVDRWRADHTQQLIDLACSEPDPRAALHLLFRLIIDQPTATNEARILLSTDPALGSVVTEIAAERIEFVTDLVVRCGFPADIARERAETSYCFVIGHEVMLAAAPELLHRDRVARKARADAVVAALLAPAALR